MAWLQRVATSMSDLDRYLIPTENAVVVVRRHWMCLARSFLYLIGWQVLGWFTLTYIADDQFFGFVGVAVILGSLGWSGWVIGDWWVERFVITDKRVLLATGLMTKRVAIMPLNRITDMTYERTVLGRLLGYGVFIMESAGQDQALSRVDYLPRPQVLYQDVSTLLFGPNSMLSMRPGPMMAAAPPPGQPPQPGQSGRSGPNEPTAPLPKL